jgi:hypothetical protein
VRMDRHTDRRTDGQTNMTKVIVGFRNFANSRKISSEIFEFRTVDLHVDVSVTNASVSSECITAL